MRDTLAEKLLAAVMAWSPEEIAAERPDLQALASFKYDAYQQYSPGMRFIESLAIWLDQFTSVEERRSAYEFVREQLIFLSEKEMHHLVSMAFPDFIRPNLFRLLASDLGISSIELARIRMSGEYARLQRQCLYLGLSDGARVDVLRRSAAEIDHEQVLASYEIPDPRATDMRKWLRRKLTESLGRTPTAEEDFFRVICLIDDFTGSGLSYVRKADDGPYEKAGTHYDGKLVKVLMSIEDGILGKALVSPDNVDIWLMLYVATDHACEQIEDTMRQLTEGSGVRFRLQAVQRLPNEARVAPDPATEFGDLLKAYYDDSIMTPALRVGGDDVIFGFNSCGLPLILSHNTPNNSVYLLWAESDKLRPLFPRVTRH